MATTTTTAIDKCKIVVLGYPGKNSSLNVAKLIKLKYLEAGFNPNNFFIVGSSDPSTTDPSFLLERASQMQAFIRKEIETNSPSMGFIDERDRLNVVFEDVTEALTTIGSEKLKMLSEFGGIRVMIFLVSEKTKPLAKGLDLFTNVFPNTKFEYISDLHTRSERDAFKKASSSTALASEEERYERPQRPETVSVKREEASSIFGPNVSHKIVTSELTAPQVQKTDILNAAVVVPSFEDNEDEEEAFRGTVSQSGQLLSVAAAIPFVKPSHSEIKDAPFVSGNEFDEEKDSSKGGIKHIQSSKVSFADIKKTLPSSSLEGSVNDLQNDTLTASTLTGPSNEKYHLHTVLSDKLSKFTNMMTHQDLSRKEAAATKTDKTLSSSSFSKIDEQIKTAQNEQPVSIHPSVSSSPPVSLEEFQAGVPLGGTAAFLPQVGKPLTVAAVPPPPPPATAARPPLHENPHVQAAATKFGLAPYDRHVVHVEDDVTFDVVCALLYKLHIPHTIVTKNDTLETQYKMIEMVFNKGVKETAKYMKILRRFRRSLQRVSAEKKAAQKALDKEVRKMKKKLEKEEKNHDEKIESEISVLLKEKEKKMISEESSSSSSDSDDDNENNINTPENPWVLVTNTILQYRPKYVSHLHVIDGGSVERIESLVDAIYLKETCSHEPKLNIIHHVAGLPHKNPTHHTGFKDLMKISAIKKRKTDSETTSSSSDSSDDDEDDDDDVLSTCCPSDDEETCCGLDGPTFEYEGAISIKDKAGTRKPERRTTSVKTNEKTNPKSGVKIRTTFETTTIYPSKLENVKTYEVSKKFQMIPCYELFDYYGGQHDFSMSELDDVPSSQQERLKEHYEDYRHLVQAKKYDFNSDPFYHYYDRLRSTNLLEGFKKKYEDWAFVVSSSNFVSSKELLY